MKHDQGLSAAWGTICRIEVVKAAICPSMSAKSRHEYFRKNFSI